MDPDVEADADAFDGASRLTMTRFEWEWVKISRQMLCNKGQWGFLILVYHATGSPESVADEVERRWPGIRTVFADATQHPDWMDLEDALAETEASGAPAIQVYGFDRWLTDPSGDWLRKLSHMNFRRNGFADRISVPILFWMRPDSIRRLARNAVDLWSWRTALYHLIDD